MLAYDLALSVCLSVRSPDADMGADMLGSVEKGAANMPGYQA